MTELIIECLIDLIIADGADAASGSERTKHWSKGAKIAVVATAIVLILAVTAVLIACGAAYLMDGNREPGAVLIVAGIAFLILTIARFKDAYSRVRKKR